MTRLETIQKKLSELTIAVAGDAELVNKLNDIYLIACEGVEIERRETIGRLKSRGVHGNLTDDDRAHSLRENVNPVFESTLNLFRP